MKERGGDEKVSVQQMETIKWLDWHENLVDKKVGRWLFYFISTARWEEEINRKIKKRIIYDGRKQCALIYQYNTTKVYWIDKIYSATPTKKLQCQWQPEKQKQKKRRAIIIIHPQVMNSKGNKMRRGGNLIIQ